MQQFLYHTDPPNPVATATIRIRDGSVWSGVQVLQQRDNWVQVDDGDGPLWVMIDQVHTDDLAKLYTLQQAEGRKN